MRAFLLLVLLLALLTGCAGDEEITLSASPLSSPITSPLDSPVLTEAPAGESWCQPSNEALGAIAGELYLLGDETPAVNSVLYIAPYTGLDTGNPLVILDPSSDLQTQTDHQGLFCLDAPPGMYGLIVWDAVESVLLNDSRNGYSLQIEVMAGETIDLGRVYTPFP